MNKKFLAIVIALALLFGAIRVVNACNGGGNCQNAPGQATAVPQSTPVLNPGGQALPSQAVANGVVNQAVTPPAGIVDNPGGQPLPVQASANGVVNAPSNGNHPMVADCSNFQGVKAVPLPQSEWITARDLHGMIVWDWKPGPTGGQNHIVATNVCVSHGGNGHWQSGLSEPANAPEQFVGWKKLAQWAQLYNQGRLVIIQ